MMTLMMMAKVNKYDIIRRMYKMIVAWHERVFVIIYNNVV